MRYLGRRGRLTTVLRSLGSLPADQRRAAGVEANQGQKPSWKRELDGRGAGGSEKAASPSWPSRSR